MSDLFGTPDGHCEERDEWRLVVTAPAVLAGGRSIATCREHAETQARQFAVHVDWHIEHRRVTVYTTPWREATR